MENSKTSKVLDSLYQTPFLFNVRKPTGMSSADVVHYFKKNLPQGFGKIGHLGTLDPFASGCLLLGVAGASKIADYVHEYLPKTYNACGVLGVQTNTGDCTGEVVETDENILINNIFTFDARKIENQIREKFMREYWQTPPQFSATKFQGRPLYKYAREGIKIVKAPVKRTIYDFKLLELSDKYFKFKCRVSSGTYIRTFFEDIAKEFDTVGHLLTLEREAIGDIDISYSLKKENWPIKNNFFDLSCALKMSDVLNLNSLVLPSDLSAKIKNGQTIPFYSEYEKTNSCIYNCENLYWVYDSNLSLIGLSEKITLENGLCFLKVKFNLKT